MCFDYIYLKGLKDLLSKEDPFHKKLWIKFQSLVSFRSLAKYFEGNYQLYSLLISLSKYVTMISTNNIWRNFTRKLYAETDKFINETSSKTKTYAMTARNENIFFYKLKTYHSRLMFVSADMFIASAFSFSVVCHGPTYLLYTWDCSITARF